jgi:hypothetical protein
MPTHRTTKPPTAAKISKEISASMRDALRALCEGWHGPDHPEQRTMVALAERKLAALRFVDQVQGAQVTLRGDLQARRYAWGPTTLGREVYVRIRLTKSDIPPDWSKMKVRPQGKVFTCRSPFASRSQLRPQPSRWPR